MKREQLLDRAYSRENLLTVSNSNYRQYLSRLTKLATQDDLGRRGDLTTKTVLKSNLKRKAKIVAKQAGVVAGVEEAVWFYARRGLETKPKVSDGERVEAKTVILELSGKEFDLLAVERTGLNLLQRMSGVASETRRAAQLAAPALVAATRKTLWGVLDHKAVTVGGGLSHRLGLWEAILIKDNHLKSLEMRGVESVTVALERAWQNRKRARFIEIEVESKDQALEAAKVFSEIRNNNSYPCIIMLDNFSAAEAAQAVKIMKQQSSYHGVLIEASGEINSSNLVAYSKTGVDVISLGYLTHSPETLDLSFSLEISYGCRNRSDLSSNVC